MDTPDITEAEKIDRSCEGLKRDIKKPEALISRQRLPQHLVQQYPVFVIHLHSDDPSSSYDIDGITKEHADDKIDVQGTLRECADVFPDELFYGLPPERRHQLSIELTEDARRRRSGVYRLAEWELEELKTQIPSQVPHRRAPPPL